MKPVHARSAGFSLVELVVVVLILGILAAIGVPRYMETLENSKADDAVATLKMIGTANRMYRLDRNVYVNPGQVVEGCNSGACNNAVNETCNLVRCGFVARQPWGSKPYIFRAGQDCGFGGANIIACARRATTAQSSGGTTSTKHLGWGYTMDQNGALRGYGTGAPPPPSS